MLSTLQFLKAGPIYSMFHSENLLRRKKSMATNLVCEAVDLNIYEIF